MPIYEAVIPKTETNPIGIEIHDIYADNAREALKQARLLLPDGLQVSDNIVIDVDANALKMDHIRIVRDDEYEPEDYTDDDEEDEEDDDDSW